MYQEFGLSEEIIALSNKVEAELENIFREVEKVNEYNSLKVLKAFQKYNLSDMHFGSTTGYGYGDIGRDTIENIFSYIFKAEDSLVRTQFVSGTHALAVALFAMLRPGETMLSINGKPYDTLHPVIGLEDNASSLQSYGVKYEQINLIENKFNIEEIKNRVAKNDIKLVAIQRSRGYEIRDSFTIDSIEEVIEEIRSVNADVIIMVDNCYGEFVDIREPIEVGADLIVGSLIKNLGGGITPNGAYISGKKALVELCAERLTAPGLGKEAGPSLGINRQILQGLFFAPQVVSSSVKTAVFASKMLEELGYEVYPRYHEKRTDIVQAIKFNDEEKLIKFCQGIQAGSPVDSMSTPEPWEMPGYANKVIMAAGAFTMGSSIELSCDAPIRPPYVAFLQGGLTYQYGKLGVLKAIENI